MPSTLATKQFAQVARRGPGRTPGLTINGDAVLDRAEQLAMTVTDVARSAEISQSQLGEAINRGKGLSPAAVTRLASALKCRPGTIAPTLIQPQRFISCRSVA